jgi:hypothetical protein
MSRSLALVVASISACLAGCGSSPSGPPISQKELVWLASETTDAEIVRIECGPPRGEGQWPCVVFKSKGIRALSGTLTCVDEECSWEWKDVAI